MNKKVIVIATSINTMGGITSVIKGYKQTKFWTDWHCVWIASHIDKNSITKIFTYLIAIFHFLFILPFSNIIHIHFSEYFSAIRKTIFIFLAKIFKKKIVTHFHSFSIESTINGKYHKLYRWIFFSSDKIIVLSDQWKLWLTKKWPELEDKIEVVYNPCPIIQNGKNVTAKTKTILYAGILNARKGYSDLIRAFYSIENKFDEWKLVFAGNGEIEEAKLLVTDLKISDKVIFKGWVNGKEKDRLFRSASIFCLPSYAEGFPMSVLDAWAYGIPVVTTPVGGLPDILEHGKNAMVFEPGDIKSLAKNLEELIINEKLREELIKASLKLSQGPFNITTISNQLNGLYEKLTIKNDV